MVQVPSLNSNNASPAADAFDSLATEYDSIWTRGVVGIQQREQVWQGILPLFHAGQRVLEIGCGTGVDAVCLARNGIYVHATDVSPRMLAMARDRIGREGLENRITIERRSIEELSGLEEPGGFDGAFSDFGAFNCVRDHRSAALSLAGLIRPGGKLALCLMNRFCLWETLWCLAHCQPSKAFRRLSAGERGVEASLNSYHRFPVFYPAAGRLIAGFRQNFDPVSSSGIGVLVPPSCMEAWALKRKRMFDKLALLDRYLRHRPVLRGMGDHRLFIFTRRTGTL
jgi:ubiquinone/menaquinone biosynthesis C-methylase UbiE